MARPRDELPPRVEEPLDAVGHLVERLAEVGELARSRDGRASGEVAGGKRVRRRFERAHAARDPPAEEQRREHRRRCRRSSDLEHVHVGVHVEHDEPAEHHRAERDRPRDEGEARELQPHGRQELQQERSGETRAGSPECDPHCEAGHGVNL